LDRLLRQPCPSQCDHRVGAGGGLRASKRRHLIHPTDINMLSVVEFAVHQFCVRHIIICGHYGCGGIQAAVSGHSYGLIDHWLEPIREVADRKFQCSKCGSWDDTESTHCARLPCALEPSCSDADFAGSLAKWQRGRDSRLGLWFEGRSAFQAGMHRNRGRKG
jgi:carbonic anhydrase